MQQAPAWPAQPPVVDQGSKAVPVPTGPGDVAAQSQRPAQLDASGTLLERCISASAKQIADAAPTLDLYDSRCARGQGSCETLRTCSAVFGSVLTLQYSSGSVLPCSTVFGSVPPFCTVRGLSFLPCGTVGVRPSLQYSVGFLGVLRMQVHLGTRGFETLRGGSTV